MYFLMLVCTYVRTYIAALLGWEKYQRQTKPNQQRSSSSSPAPSKPASTVLYVQQYTRSATTLNEEKRPTEHEEKQRRKKEIFPRSFLPSPPVPSLSFFKELSNCWIRICRQSSLENFQEYKHVRS